MKAKLLILMAIAALCVSTPAFGRQRVVQTRDGRAVVVNNHRHYSRGSSVYWNVGVGVPFFGGGYYSGYPYYGGGYYSGYPSYYGGYYGGYPYGYNYSPYGYNGYYSNSSYPYHYNRYSSYRDANDSVVIRVQQRLARAGYYRGAIDGVIGPRTQYAIRAYERNHGLPADGVIDHRLLQTLGLA
jgi:putative peptidoglycan binding protein